MLKYCLLSWPLLVLLMPEALAQIPFPREENRWEISMFAGVSGLGDKTLVTPVEGGTTREVGLNFDSGYLAWVFASEKISRRVSGPSWSMLWPINHSFLST